MTSWKHEAIVIGLDRWGRGFLRKSRTVILRSVLCKARCVALLMSFRESAGALSHLSIWLLAGFEKIMHGDDVQSRRIAALRHDVGRL